MKAASSAPAASRCQGLVTPPSVSAGINGARGGELEGWSRPCAERKERGHDAWIQPGRAAERGGRIALYVDHKEGRYHRP